MSDRPDSFYFTSIISGLARLLETVRGRELVEPVHRPILLPSGRMASLCGTPGLLAWGSRSSCAACDRELKF